MNKLFLKLYEWLYQNKLRTTYKHMIINYMYKLFKHLLITYGFIYFIRSWISCWLFKFITIAVLGLVSDAVHLTFGCGLLTFSLFVMGASRKKPDGVYTYGWDFCFMYCLAQCRTVCRYSNITYLLCNWIMMCKVVGSGIEYFFWK